MDELFEAPSADKDVTVELPPKKAPRRAQKEAAPQGAFFEYLAPDGKPWRCDVRDKLFTDFGIAGDADTRRDELTRLHGDVGPVRESWEVIRRVYRLAPVIGATKEELLQKDGAGRSQKALDDLVQRRSSLQSTYENTLERLGATQEQNPGYRAKVAFGDSLGHLAKAMQEYYADGNNALVDGLFTAAEIKLLVTPTSLRPAQYRPDLPMLVEQWRANFWNPEWEGVKLPRKTHRFLLATFKKASEEFAEGKVAEMDGCEVEAGDMEMAFTEGGADAPDSTTAGGTSADFAKPAPTTAAPAGNARAARADKDFAGWVS